jgi:hypothetical protein
MIYLKEGLSGPSVVALQIMLNRQLPKGVAPLKVDGFFGPKTKTAVLKFQAAHGLKPSEGIVGQETWPALTGHSLVTLNVVDITDPELIDNADDIRRVNGNPILRGGMSNGLKSVLGESNKAGSNREVPS